MAKNLTEKEILRIMREEWDKKVSSLKETIDITFKSKVKDEDKELLSPGLKVLHKNSGIRYTVQSVGVEDIVLKTPEGKDFLVDKHELEKEYELD